MRASIAIVALAASVVSAAPLARRDTTSTNKTDIDPTVLNYALTLEHLEAAFYKGGLASYSADDFQKAGYPDWVRYRLTEIASHEATHVSFLTSALEAAGANATAACTYAFPDTDPASFLAVAQVLEGVGVSAYTGAANLITDGTYLTVAASILAIEARHASWIRGAAQHEDSFPTAFDIPLGLNQVYSLAAPFITSCPSTNPALPVKAFPTLTASAGPYSIGETIQLSFSGSTSVTGAVAVFYSGLTQTPVAYDASTGNVVIPEGIAGQAYVVISSQNATVTDETTLAGPAVIEIPFQATLVAY